MQSSSASSSSVKNAIGRALDMGAGYISLVSQSVANQRVFSRSTGNSPYVYAPDMLYFNGSFHIYACAGVGGIGDYVIHSQSSSPEGPFHSSVSNAANSYDVSMRPTGDTSNFDGTETCDPSVIQSNGTFYLYYGGLATDSNSTSWGKIGVATGTDGVHFTRANNGRALVSPVLYRTNAAHDYGAGQPSVIYIAPYFYMSFTDSTAPGFSEGAGQFMIRATDPLFSTDVQELTAGGWQAIANANSRSGSFSFLAGLSIDMAYDPMSDKVMITNEMEVGKTGIFIVDPNNNFATLGYGELDADWNEGAAILKNPDHTLMARANCASLPISSYFTWAKNPNTVLPVWIARSEGVFDITGACANAPAAAPAVAIAPAIASSPQSRFVAQLYSGILGRQADPSEISGWTNVALSGSVSCAQLALGFLNSAEFTNEVPNLGHDGVVKALYAGLLGRAGDAQGFAAWTGALDAQSLNLSQVESAFSRPQNSTKTAPQTTASQAEPAHSNQPLEPSTLGF